MHCFSFTERIEGLVVLICGVSVSCALICHVKAVVFTGVFINQKFKKAISYREYNSSCLKDVLRCRHAYFFGSLVQFGNLSRT
jgi:hypothetical protein